MKSTCLLKKVISHHQANMISQHWHFSSNETICLPKDCHQSIIMDKMINFIAWKCNCHKSLHHYITNLNPMVQTLSKIVSLQMGVFKNGHKSTNLFCLLNCRMMDSCTMWVLRGCIFLSYKVTDFGWLREYLTDTFVYFRNWKSREWPLVTNY